jgi:fructokinase
MILYGGIHTSGANFICAIGDQSGQIFEKEIITRTTPEETLSRIIHFFKNIQKITPIAAIGIACFGPLDLNPASPTYGYITTSTKPGWLNIDILSTLKSAFNCPIGIDTDVNGAALGELRWGAGQGLDTFLHVIVGLGIGVGAISRGRLMHGLLHPEMGHILIPQQPQQDRFGGTCPFHGNCLEGLAGLTALLTRWDALSLDELPPSHKAWELESDYLAYAVANWILTTSPQRVFIGGSIIDSNPQLLPKIRKKTQHLLNGFIHHKNILEKIDDYIISPALSPNSGLCGALALADYSFQEQQTHQERIQQELTDHVYQRPWGTYQPIFIDHHYRIVLLTIKPHSRLSLQKHMRRTEHWTILQGKPSITLHKQTKVYHPKESVLIPDKQLHRIENFTDQTVIIVEIQMGDYLEPDDLIRLDDVYGRK